MKAMSLFFVVVNLVALCPFSNDSDQIDFQTLCSNSDTVGQKHRISEDLPHFDSLTSQLPFNIFHLNTEKYSLEKMNISESTSITMFERSFNFGKKSTGFKTGKIKKQISFDDNLEIVDYKKYDGYPISPVGLCRSYGGNSYGTAFMIGNGFALTAAHCVADKYNFYRGKTEIGFKLNSISDSGILEFEYDSSVSDIYVPARYFSLDSKGDPVANLNFDWAILKLSNPDITKEVGALSIGSGLSLLERQSTFVGFTTKTENGLTNLYSSTGMREFEESEYRYRLFQYIYQGMSGGPLITYYFDQNTLEEFSLVVGICSSIKPDEGGFISEATKISNLLIDTFRYLK